MAAPDFKSLLDDVASHSDSGIHIYGHGDTQKGQWISYTELRDIAKQNAIKIHGIDGFQNHGIILLHFDNHLDNIIWFWSVAYAGCVPTMSTPFVNNPEGRKSHIKHLYNLLEDPICLTRNATVHRGDFKYTSVLRLCTVDDLENKPLVENGISFEVPGVRDDGLAILMLTSGSTGNAKAVCLTHSNLLASMRGKASYTTNALPNTSYFNFIGLDHVAGLLEVHLRAIHSKDSQVHIQSADLISEPLQFLYLTNKHRVSLTLAPNFFLSKLRSAMESAEARLATNNLDLSCLTHIVSGGEANVVETADALSRHLSKFGAPRGCIIPAFGMTETCAGAIVNLGCPDYDIGRNHEFTSVGKCCPGIEMRINVSNTSIKEPSHDVNDGVGDLEVRGEVVFERYYNNQTATKDSFTPDGWFKTGDQAVVDSEGHLSIVGRTKDTMTINGVKYLPHEVEFAIEEAEIPGVAPSFIVCFDRRFPGASTETACVIYLPTYQPDDTTARMRALDGIAKIVVLQTGSKPYVLPLTEGLLQKTTLGKLSRSKIRKALIEGQYSAFEEQNKTVINDYREAHFSAPVTEAEKVISGFFNNVLGLEEGELGIDAPYFEAGLTSIDLIKAKRHIEKAFQMTEEVPMSTIMTQSTIRLLAQTVESLTSTEPRPYNPVVTLKHSGHKTPLFLFHPGVGEILVFFGLVKFVEDRPVHALRARGLNKGEPFFTSIDEVIEVYYSAIRKTQPKGPYAMAGYSFGSMLAFEIAKKLEAGGEEVRFLGVFNLPPHIKWRMRQFDWVECLVHLAYFTDLISEDSTTEVSAALHKFTSKDSQMDHLLELARPERLEELAMTKSGLMNWVDAAFSIQSSAVDYEPAGKVARMDVFYCRPLKLLGITKQQWLEQYLRPWEEFTSDAQYHAVDGAHYTMLLPEHVGSFQRHLNKALKMRGV